MAAETAGSGNHARLGAAAATTHPLTMFAYVKPDDITSDHLVMALHNDTSPNHRFDMNLRGSVAGDFVNALHKGATTTGTAVTSNAFVADTWQTVCGVYTSTTDVKVYVDNAGEGSETVDIGAPSGIHNTSIFTGVSSFGQAFIGSGAHFAIWNVALTADERATLQLGYSPLFVRPGNLVFYLPCIGGDATINLLGAAMTETGTITEDDHPRVIMPDDNVVQFVSSSSTSDTNYTGANRGIMRGVARGIG